MLRAGRWGVRKYSKCGAPRKQGQTPFVLAVLSEKGGNFICFGSPLDAPLPALPELGLLL